MNNTMQQSESATNKYTLGRITEKVKECLFSNAAKFTEGGTITLTKNRETRDDRDWLIFSVRDTGVGVIRNYRVSSRISRSYSDKN